MDSTNVETKSFYMTSDEGVVGMAQVIYSNVLGIRTTAQFSSKIFSNEPGKPHLWASDSLNNPHFSPDKLDFMADNCEMKLSEDGRSYHIKSSTNRQAIVDLTFTLEAPGFKVGQTGTSNFGTDPAKPWGRMWHFFWPRCKVEGNILTQQGPVDFKGKGMVSHALQGMKPHFAAAKWNFVNFQSPTYSAIMMEYTTPESYGHTVVNVGGIVTDNQVIFTGASPNTKATHDETKPDSDNAWPAPEAATYTWQGKTADGKPAFAELKGTIGPRADRIDVMGEVPKFVKQIVAGAAGTKPYIYQYTQKLKLKIKIGDEEKEEEGILFTEATFIS